MEKQFLKKIERTSIAPHNNFNLIGINIISNILFPFLTYNEIKELKKINILFYNSFINYISFWFNDLKNILNEYKISFPSTVNTISKIEAIDKKIKFKCPYDKCHYIEFDKKGINHIGLFKDEDWSWKNDERYFITKLYKNSFLGEETPYLISVCWIDINLTMTHIKEGNYKLFFKHSVYKANKECMKLNIFLDGKEIFFSLYPTQTMIENDLNNLKKYKEENKNENQEDKKKEDENKEDEKIEENKELDINKNFRLLRRPFYFRNRNIYNLEEYLQEIEYENLLYKELIVNFEIKDDDIKSKEEGHKIEIKFFHNNDTWKNNWGFDSVYLVEE